MTTKSILGFTLIELLVVFSLVGILSAIGLASYINFNRRQLVIQTARKVVQDLRLAQSLAENNQKPSESCGTLNGYTFLRSNGTTYEINIDCFGPVYDGNPIKTVNIPSGLNMSGFTQVKFKILRQGLGSVGGTSLSISGFGKTSRINVDSGGVIAIESE